VVRGVFLLGELHRRSGEKILQRKESGVPAENRGRTDNSSFIRKKKEDHNT